METYGDHGILYSKEYFSEEVIAELAEPRREVAFDAKAAAAMMEAPHPELTPEAAFAQRHSPAFRHRYLPKR